MSKKNIHLSLVLSTKNRVKEVEKNLESLASQTYKNFELIFIDQNSDNRLEELINTYSQKFSLEYIKYTETGLSRARNKGLEKIKGELFGFPDDDCIYPSIFLEQVVNFFQKSPQWGGLIINVFDLEEDKEAMLFRPFEAGIVDYEKGWMVGMTAALFFRSDFAKKVKFDEELGPGTPWGGAEDVDYLYACLDAGAKTYFEPKIVIRHPTPYKIYSIPQSIRREYNHGRGAGFVMAKYNFTLKKVFNLITIPLRAFLPTIFKGKARAALYFPGISLGRLQGYIGFLTQGKKTQT